jgi:hypothetical protein
MQIQTVRKNKLTGELELNRVKKFARPFFLLPTSTAAGGATTNTMTLAAVAASTAIAPMNVGQEGPFEGYSLLCQSTRFTAVGDHEFTVRLEDRGYNRALMNREIHGNCLFGTSAFPSVLHEYLFLDRTASLLVSLQAMNFAIANAVRPVFAGNRLYAGSDDAGELKDLIGDLQKRKSASCPFWLTTDQQITAQPAGTTRSYLMSVGSDGYFDAYDICAVWYDTTLGAGNMNAGTFDWNLKDAETKRQLMTGNLSNQLGIGNAMTPFCFPNSLLNAPTQQLELEIISTHANPLTIYFCLVGRKYFI